MSNPQTITVDSPVQRLVAEMAVALAKEMETTAQQAPDGTVLEVCEQLVLERGRKLMRTALEATLQAQAEQVEKRGRRTGPAPAANPCTPRASIPVSC